MITFFVPGIPIAKGSAKAFFNKGMKHAVVVQDNAARQKPWASMISYCAQEAGCCLSPSAIAITLHFTMPRPKSHYGTGKNAAILKRFVPDYHTAKPDLDKLIRCVKDALTGVAWKDDSQVCFMGEVWKKYGETPGVLIKIEEV
jgi:Holliday junction resolvase RusA-like endonuclease